MSDARVRTASALARPAVFLDRDGTMIHESGYLSRLEELQWFPWTIDAVRLLNRAGFLVIVVTNQGGVGLGLFEEPFVHAVHDVMTNRIVQGGGRIDGWFYCPHHPQATVPALRVACECRKPQPGLIREAQQRFAIDLPRSFGVGDKSTDLTLASNVGARGVLVRTGYGEGELAKSGAVASAAFVAANLMDAVSWILIENGHPREDA
jgi:D-glycero-D-manno-heptose 1,7-bisphosphate phosphatase